MQHHRVRADLKHRQLNPWMCGVEEAAAEDDRETATEAVGALRA